MSSKEGLYPIFHDAKRKSNRMDKNQDEDKENNPGPSTSSSASSNISHQRKRPYPFLASGCEKPAKRLTLNQQDAMSRRSERLKRKADHFEQENEQLKQELELSNAKVNAIQNNAHFQELIAFGQAAEPPIGLFDGLIPEARPGHAKRFRFQPPSSKKVPKDFVFDQTRHPLRNDVVLDVVFSYLADMNTLKSCRVVNRAWNNHAIRRFKESHTPIQLGNSRTVFEFAEDMRKSMNPPYFSFVINKTYVPRFANHFKKFSHKVEELKLVSKRSSYSQSGVPNRDLINLANVLNIITSTPNLRILELSGIRFPVYIQPLGLVRVSLPHLKEIIIKLTQTLFSDAEIRHLEDEHHQEANLTLQRLFGAAPHLHKLKLEIFGRPLLPKFLPATQPIGTLKSLELNNCIHESHLRYLIPAMYNLKVVKLTIHLETCDLLREFLVRQAGTLEHLDLNVSTFRQTQLPIMELPVFPRLRKLKFISAFSQSFSHRLPFRRRTDLIDFPSLQHLWASEDIIREVFTLEDHIAPAVENLNYEVSDRAYGCSESLRSLNTYFPKLRKLTMRKPNFYQVRSIFQSASDYLEELCIDYSIQRESQTINSLLTGIPDPGWMVSQLSKLKGQGKLVEYVILNFLRRKNEVVSLLDLKRLKRLEIFSPLYGVNDSSGYISFLALHPLECLTLHNSSLSDTCVAELKSHHNMVITERTSIKDRDESLLKQFALL